MAWLVATSPIWATLLWHVWDLGLRPRLLPTREVEALADAMIALHGPRAEEAAFIEEDSAWRRSEIFQQGKWHRVRRELWRRYERGEWAGP